MARGVRAARRCKPLNRQARRGRNAFCGTETGAGSGSAAGSCPGDASLHDATKHQPGPQHLTARTRRTPQGPDRRRGRPSSVRQRNIRSQSDDPRHFQQGFSDAQELVERRVDVRFLKVGWNIIVRRRYCSAAVRLECFDGDAPVEGEEKGHVQAHHEGVALIPLAERLGHVCRRTVGEPDQVQQHLHVLDRQRQPTCEPNPRLE
eukprot:scaffold31179_cov101-Isochrysis_galbana.AAC.5